MHDAARRDGLQPPVLYVHGRTCGPGRDVIMPSGLLTLLSACRHPVLGVFENELSDPLIVRSRVVLVDCHWYMHLASVLRIAEWVRRVNPSARVVVGGYTATVFARELVEAAPIDVVVRGDADPVLPQLLDALLEGAPYDHLANLTTPRVHNPLSAFVTPDGFAMVGATWPDWFPSLAAILKRYQRTGYPNYTYPFVQVSRGCLYACEQCAGSPTMQRALCGRAMVQRSAEHVRAEFRAWEEQPKVRLVHILGDLDSHEVKAQSEAILAERYDIDLYYEFFNVPEPELLERFRRAFRTLYCCVAMSVDHGEGTRLAEPRRLERFLECGNDLGVRVTLFVNHRVAREHRGYLRDVLSLLGRHRFSVIDIAEWDLDPPVPDEDAVRRAAAFRRFLDRSRRDSPADRLRGGLLHHAVGSKNATWVARRIGSLMAIACLASGSVKGIRSGSP